MTDMHVASLTTIADIAHEEDHRWKRGDGSGHMRLMLAQVQTLEQRQQGRRTDLESTRRNQITDVIQRSGFTRPLIGVDANAVGMLRDEIMYLSQGVRAMRV
jgi:hypothetical protein